MNAGHNPPILCWENAMKSELLKAGTTILGAFDELPFLEIGEREKLDNFTIHLYTDGLTESMNPEEEEFGEERFQRFVDNHLCVNPEDFHREFFLNRCRHLPNKYPCVMTSRFSALDFGKSWYGTLFLGLFNWLFPKEFGVVKIQKIRFSSHLMMDGSRSDGFCLE